MITFLFYWKNDIQYIPSLHSNEKSKNLGVDLSATSYGVICSALIHLYPVSEKDMDQGFKK